MNSTQAKISGGGVAGLICWLWNSILCVSLGLPEVMQMQAEVGVALGMLCVAVADKYLNTALPLGEVTTTAPVPEPAPMPDGGGREAPVPFA
jgi:hypothetical protein